MPSSGSAEDDATVIVGASSDRSSESPSVAFGEPPGEAHLGRYLVIEELGRGAMGVVLRAYDPKLQREVALKRLRVGKLDPSAQVRLIREARAMARLSHPNVVAVYDVEAEPDTARSDVLVVMEYVRGTTLTQWLRSETRSCAAIVSAFVSAGRGLAAAHAEGLLHRDFKPDNVLVGSDARVRVTDFGLARSTSSRQHDISSTSGEFSGDDLENPDLTAVGTVMGTPRYMAPEQSMGSELDARVDQYAFCVSLWRALTTAWPFDGNDPDALMQAKLRGPPAWPTHVAAPRHIVAAIRRGLAPAAKDRWPSLAELLAELDRDPGRRRQRIVGLGVVAIAALGVWGARTIQRARAVSACAHEGERITEVWHEARADAIATAFAATGLSYAPDTWSRARPRLDAFASEWQATRTDVCERADVEQDLPPGLATSARECLDEHRDDLEALLEQLAEPNATAIQNSAGASASLPLASLCTDETYLRARIESPDEAVHASVVELRKALAKASAARETGHLEEAVQGATAVVDAATQLGWAPLLAEARIDLGDTYDDLGRYEESRVVLENAYFGASAASRDDLALRAASLLVHVHGELSRFDQGIYWGRLGTAIVERGQSHELAVASLHANMASLDFWRGENARAIEQYERVLEVRERLLGTEHPDVASVLNNLGLAHAALGDAAAAVQYHARALAIWEHALGENNPQVGVAAHNLSWAYVMQDDLDEALAMDRRALAIWEVTLEPDHPNVSAALHGLGNVYYDRHEYETALDCYLRARAILERTLEPDHIEFARTYYATGSVHVERGNYDQAFADHLRALTIRQKHLGADHRDVGGSLEALSDIRYRQGRYAEAIELGERALAVRKHPGAMAADLAGTQAVLAKSLWASGRDRPRALELARAAAATFHALDETSPRRKDLDAWLASHDKH